MAAGCGRRETRSDRPAKPDGTRRTIAPRSGVRAPRGGQPHGSPRPRGRSRPQLQGGQSRVSCDDDTVLDVRDAGGRPGRPFDLAPFGVAVDFAAQGHPAAVDTDCDAARLDLGMAFERVADLEMDVARFDART